MTRKDSHAGPVSHSFGRTAAKRRHPGYTIVNEYFKSLTDFNRAYRMREIERLQSDLYTGELIRKYPIGCMPVWVMFEALSFGAFINFYLYCANRWHDKEMKARHYLLHQAKAIRNAVAHSSDIINGFASTNSHIRTPSAVNRAIAQTGISSTMRNNKMRNPRIQQIVMLMHIYREFIDTSEWHTTDTQELRIMMHHTEQWTPGNTKLHSTIYFLGILLDSWFIQPVP